jgi:hypothetical protein
VNTHPYALVCSRGLMPDPKLKARDPRLAAAMGSWLSVLPSGKRATLELQLDAAATPRAKWEVLRKAAERDDTKVRAPARRALLYHDTGRSPRSPRLQVQEEAARFDANGGGMPESEQVRQKLARLGKLAAGGMEVDPDDVRAATAAAARLVGSMMTPQQATLVLGAFGRMAGLEMDHDDVRVVTDAAARLAGSMSSEQVAVTLNSFGRLAACGLDMDDGGAVTRAVTDAAVRLSGSMKPGQLAPMLNAFGKIAESGLSVGLDDVRAMTDAAARLAGSIGPHQLAGTLASFGRLAACGLDVDGGAVRAVTDAAVSLASSMNHGEVTGTLTAFVSMAEGGLDVDHDALRAVTEAAARFSGSMSYNQASGVLGRFGRLAKSGVAVDPVAVQVYTDAAIRASVEMKKVSQVQSLLTAFVDLAESGLVAVDPVAVRALRDAAARAADDMRDDQRTSTLSWLEKLTASLESLQHATGARAPSGALTPSAAEATIRTAFCPDRDPHLALAAAADSWLAALPSGKRAKLETQLAAAATQQDKWEMLRESAEDDKTKARAARRALLLQEAARALAL